MNFLWFPVRHLVQNTKPIALQNTILHYGAKDCKLWIFSVQKFSWFLLNFIFKVTYINRGFFNQLFKMYLIFAASLLHLFMQGGLVYVILKVIEEIVKYCWFQKSCLLGSPKLSTKSNRIKLLSELCWFIEFLPRYFCLFKNSYVRLS